VVAPADWKEVRLGDLLGYEQPTKYLVSSSDYVEGGQVPVLTAGKSFLLGYTDDADGIYTNLPTIIFDDFTTATQWVDFEFKVKSSACKMLRPKNGACNPRYVFERLRALNFQTSDHKRHWISVFHSMEMLMPPLKEQEVIAEALTDADKAIESLDALITKKRDVKQATMQQLLTGRTRLPGFTADWKDVRLGECLTIMHGKNQSQIVDPEGRYPILATGGVIGRTNSYLSNKPSVLIGRKGTIDRPQYMDTPFWTVDTLFYSEVKNGNSAKFLFYKFLMVNWKKYNEASGVPSLNASTIENVEMLMPPLKEQEAIAEALTVMDDELEALTEQVSKLRMVKEGMMQDLLTGKVRLV
jgi:type I restriction enzyme S subunit